MLRTMLMDNCEIRQRASSSGQVSTQQPSTKLLVATTPTSSTTLRALPTVFIWSGCWYQSQLAIKDIKPSPAEFLLRESSYLLWKMIKISVAYFVSNHEEFKNEAKSNLELMFCSAVSTQAGLTTHLSCSGLACCGRCGGRRWGRRSSTSRTAPGRSPLSPGTSRGPTSVQSTETLCRSQETLHRSQETFIVSVGALSVSHVKFESWRTL